MIEHVSIPIKDYKRAKKFYEAALKPLGYKLKMEFAPDAAGFMEGGHTSFWIVKKSGTTDIHVALLAKNKKAVIAFYEAAMKAGGKDNGPPGPRPEYSKGYYAGFVIDPDGNNIEAVYFEPPSRKKAKKSKRRTS